MTATTFTVTRAFRIWTAISPLWASIERRKVSAVFHYSLATTKNAKIFHISEQSYGLKLKEISSPHFVHFCDHFQNDHL